MTRIFRSVGFVLALATVGLGAARAGLVGRCHGGRAVGRRHAPPAGLGALRPRRPLCSGDPGEYREPRRMAGRRRRLHQQHRGVQPVQHAPDDRRHRGTDPRNHLGEWIPGVHELARGLCRHGGHPGPAQHVGHHRRAPGGERHARRRRSSPWSTRAPGAPRPTGCRATSTRCSARQGHSLRRRHPPPWTSTGTSRRICSRTSSPSQPWRRISPHWRRVSWPWRRRSPRSPAQRTNSAPHPAPSRGSPSASTSAAACTRAPRW